MKTVHCELCNCPIEIWEPLKSYPTCRSCEFYYDIYDLAWDIEQENGKVDTISLFAKAQGLADSYPDIPDLNAAISECFEILKGCGVITT